MLCRQLLLYNNLSHKVKAIYLAMFVQNLYTEEPSVKEKFFRPKAANVSQAEYKKEYLAPDGYTHTSSKYQRKYAYDQATRFVTKLYNNKANMEFVPSIEKKVATILYSNMNKPGNGNNLYHFELYFFKQ
jgi:hypothetical protein